MHSTKLDSAFLKLIGSSLIALLTVLSGSIQAAKAQSDSLRRVQGSQIEVTSTPFKEPLTEAPMSITVVPQELFLDSRSYELRDALWSVPGVFAQSRSGHSDVRITIRGFGSRGAGDRSNAGNMRGVRVLQDGIPETEPDGRTSLDIVDLNAVQHLEVLRGNASSQFGSASGGVINLSTMPEFTSPYSESRNTFGSFGFMKNSLIGGARLGASRLALTATRTEYDGFRTHSNASSGNVTLNLASPLDASTEARVTLAAASNIFRFPGPLTMSDMLADPAKADSAYVARDEHRFNRVGRLGFTLDHAFGGGHSGEFTLFYQPKVLTRSERGSWREFNRYTVGGMARYAFEAEVAENTTNRIALGYDQQYQDGTIMFFALGPNASRSATLRDNKREAAGVRGVYLQDELEIARFRLLAGARMDHIEYIAENRSSTAPQETKDFSHISPRAALSYKVAEDHTLYASYGQGVEAPAFNEIDPPDSAATVSHGGVWPPVSAFNPFLDPATSSTIELGLRGEVISSGFITRVTYDATAFRIKVKNDIIPWNGGAFYFTAGNTSRNGLELAGSVYTDIGLSLMTSITAMKGTYDEYANQLGDFSGNEMAGVPGFFANTRLRYDSPVGLFAEAMLEQSGQYYADDRNDMTADGAVDLTVNSLAPAYSLIHATVGYRDKLGPVGIDLFAGLRNITNQVYASSVFINGVNNKYFEPGMPRNFVGGVSLRYGF